MHDDRIRSTTGTKEGEFTSTSPVGRTLEIVTRSNGSSSTEAGHVHRHLAPVIENVGAEVTADGPGDGALKPLR